ncbi:voltage-dependent anion-selective channel-like isoform X2 [Drosophila sulfurigaster albostrigata]|uniref:voltage-dependent anion-selective channel-like isoform X2 n=1 Tax=Drosophila sulfurigaster albostrigata TaxID=89887 RepID=UPI002D21B80F|nr:voltage-dependent anion-selective channel-like isoform X2 [Drosophila sulfurigaster albostrigata]
MSNMLKRISKIKRRSRQPAEGDASSGAGETSEDSSEVSKVDFIPPLEIEKKMPTYFTMGILAKECLIRGFEIGVWHLECTMRSNNLSTYSIGKANPDLNSVSGGVGMREKFGSFSLAQAWQTDGLLGMIGANSEVLGAGVYSVLKGFYGPHGSAAPKVELLAGFERAPLKSEIIIPVLHSPKFMGYLLLQPIEHFLFGGRLEFDVEQRQIDMHALCVGYVDDTTEYMLKLEKFKDLRGSVFQRLGDKWAFALKANLFGENMKAFTVGGQYQVDEKTLLKARISNDCQVGFVCQIKVTDNIEGIYYFGFDGNSPMSGDHKVGISWSFKA